MIKTLHDARKTGLDTLLSRECGWEQTYCRRWWSETSLIGAKLAAAPKAWLSRSPPEAEPVPE